MDESFQTDCKRLRLYHSKVQYLVFYGKFKRSKRMSLKRVDRILIPIFNYVYEYQNSFFDTIQKIKNTFSYSHIILQISKHVLCELFQYLVGHNSSIHISNSTSLNRFIKSNALQIFNLLRRNILQELFCS